MKKWLKRLTLFFLLLFLTGGAYLGWAYSYYVVQNPGEHIDKAYILKALSKESAVYYRDGETQLHAFYQEQHRIYVPYEEIPQYWVQAITASEDKRFFSHYGLDPIGISRAMVSNVKARRLVAGGSTLTQQTAKNVFNRPDRSLNSKAEEALNALRLEHHFSKEEILEFYANQFHVSGNGRGIGVAARYYFNKTTSELSLIECAFIAGMLQGPGLYDPFVTTSRKGQTVEERRALNLERAQRRTEHVLKRMLAEGHISESLYTQLIAQPIPFQRGVFQYSANSTVDEVKKRLQEPPFAEILQEYNIDNPATAGLKIVTTIDPDIQRHALYGLVHHLSDVGGKLEGVELSDVIHSNKSVLLEERSERKVGDLFYAKITAVGQNSLTVEDGNGPCIVDSSALDRLSTILRKAKDTKWGRNRSALLSALPMGSIVWASVREITDEKVFCDVEIHVELQGAVLALQKGEILAMVGGTQNMDFNRAVDAKRQLGSTWKPLIYTAALQLGWSPLDILDNRGNVFPFERVWYAPRSGHLNAERYPSLTWTGVNSENRASVWLLYHLSDRLSVADYETLIQKVGLSPAENEDNTAYIKRIRDDLGVISTAQNLEEIAFYAAKRDLLNSDETEAYEETDVLQIQSLLHGRGVEKELSKLKDAENQWLAQVNYTSVHSVYSECIQHFEADMEQFILDEEHVPTAPLWWSERLQRVGCGVTAPEVVTGAEEEFTPISREQWLSWVRTGQEPEIWIHGVISGRLWERLEQGLLRHRLLLQDSSSYSLGFLKHHPDFIQIVHMRYINYLLNNLGIEGTLPLTLTMPLGSVDLSLLDAAMLYNGLLTGQRTKVAHEVQKGNILIQRIEGPTGEVLFSAEPTTQQVSNFVSGMLLSDILYNVVQFGTAQRAKRLTTEEGIVIPALGKTGTTNGFQNAAFVGMIPKATVGEWSVADGVVLASYVGYDTPKSMKYGNLSLSGASGALPVWMETAKGVAESDFIGEPNEVMKFVAPEANGFHAVAVDSTRGHSNEEGEASVWVYDPNVLWGQDPVHIRAFSPVDAEYQPEWPVNLPIDSLDTSNLETPVLEVRMVPEHLEDTGSHLVDTPTPELEFRLVPE